MRINEAAPIVKVDLVAVKAAQAKRFAKIKAEVASGKDPASLAVRFQMKPAVILAVAGQPDDFRPHVEVMKDDRGNEYPVVDWTRRATGRPPKDAA